jgi:hypothetical protein
MGVLERAFLLSPSSLVLKCLHPISPPFFFSSSHISALLLFFIHPRYPPFIQNIPSSEIPRHPFLCIQPTTPYLKRFLAYFSVGSLRFTSLSTTSSSHFSTMASLFRVNIIRNTNYKASGIKSLVWLMQKYDFAPTLAGPIQHSQKATQNVGNRRFPLVKQQADGTTGEV